MLKLIIKKELKEILNSSKFVYSFGVCALLILVTFYVGAKNYQINRSQYDAAVSENIRSMSGVTDWRMISHKIFLPPQPLASLVSGISNDIGRNIQLQGRGELTARDSKYNEEPIFAVFRFLDLNFLFQIILSLFAILFCYNAVNGEKKRGTLRLIFSNSLPRDKFILGKVIGSIIALAVPLLIPMLLGSLLLIIMGIPMEGSDWIKLSLIILAGFLLFSAFMNLSVFVSTLTQSPSTSFLLLLVIWILFVLVIPKSSVLIAGRAVDVPSVDQLNTKKSQFAAQLNREHFNSLNNFKPSSTDKVFEEFQKFMEKSNTSRDEKMQLFNEKLNRERINRQEIQKNLALNISRISPGACFSLASASLAGTSLDLIKNYRDQANSYQKKFAEFQKEKTGMTTGGGMMFVIRNDNDEKPPEINPSELPKFNFVPASLNESIYGSVTDFGLLLIFNLIFFAGSYIRFLKFDLR
ncbi:MAG TPA: ABC transporter permease subunit [Melioribacteraceae bacterium]|mgnify:CR=1 FL=1|nr:ABC transporter permease subunit [Melioribacteraceae bacterium]